MAFYEALEQKKAGIQIAFASMFTLIALIVLLSADLVRPELRQPARRADPSPDPCDRPGRDRQFLCPGAGAAGRGRSRPSGRDLQQDDLGAAPPARRPDRRERPHGPPPPLHRSGAGRRLGRRDRHRRPRAHHHRQPLDRGPARRPRARNCSARPITMVLPEVAASGRGDEPRAAAADAAADPDLPPRARSAPSTSASPASRPAARSGISSSRSTTSPISSRRSAPPPGPTWRAASRTRSRTR